MSTGTHPAEQYMADYIDAFEDVYSRTPIVRYMGNQWYQINGETIHHTLLVSEITRLRDLAQLQRKRTTRRGLIDRLVNKLRSM